MTTTVKVLIGVTGLVAVSAAAYFLYTKMKKSSLALAVDVNKAKMAAARPAQLELSKAANGAGKGFWSAGIVEMNTAVAVGIVTEAEKKATEPMISAGVAMAIEKAKAAGTTGQGLGGVGSGSSSDITKKYVDTRVSGQSHTSAMDITKKWCELTFKKA